MFDDCLFDDMPRLETPRLILRRLEMRDAPDLFDYSRDPQVAKHVLWDAQTSVSEARAYVRYMLRRYRAGEPASWGIEEKETGRVVGTIGYMWYQRDNNACEVGYSLARRRWNRGYMTEALARVINHPALRDLPFYLETPCDLDGYRAEIALLRSLRAE